MGRKKGRNGKIQTITLGLNLNTRHGLLCPQTGSKTKQSPLTNKGHSKLRKESMLRMHWYKPEKTKWSKKIRQWKGEASPTLQELALDQVTMGKVRANRPR